MSILFFLLIVIIIIRVFFNQPKFGKFPSGARLEKIKKSPNYKNKAFQNLSDTPSLSNGATYFSVLKDFFFTKHPRKEPADILPSVKINLKELDPSKNSLVWFGHSSYFMQVDGKKILVDPVFSGAASPLSFTTRAFKGADRYSAADMPEIDYLFISHDHWDHLDYKTVIQLQPKVKTIICSLGVGAHLERWGFSMDMIIERDWNETILLEDSFKVNTVPARHFSGRGFKRNQTLWTSFVLQTPHFKIFLGGDSGYDTHFKTIGDEFGPFDWAILEVGQYNLSWQYIHMLPEEVLQAAKDLRAHQLLPVHNSKFALSLHSWDEPLQKISSLHKESDFHLVTPKIGEEINLDLKDQHFEKWWEKVK